MCATCGCSDSNQGLITNLQTGEHIHLNGSESSHVHHHQHGHTHVHTHSHDHGHSHGPERSIDARLQHLVNRPQQSPTVGQTRKLELDLLARNDSEARQNRLFFGEHKILAVNFMSSPGSGKTTLLEKTIQAVGCELSIQVMEGDQATFLDAERIQKAGAPVVQINTGAACHLDAQMVRRGLELLRPPEDSILFIENVGNLVCPALFDLGERLKVVVASVTEGDDKPLKYPQMFAAADIVVLNKIDLMPYVSFNQEMFQKRVMELSPKAVVLPLSATRGDGMENWFQTLRSYVNRARELRVT
jgi:hydrogenase nickel incorporation protein HypB